MRLKFSTEGKGQNYMKTAILRFLAIFIFSAQQNVFHCGVIGDIGTLNTYIPLVFILVQYFP